MSSARIRTMLGRCASAARACDPKPTQIAKAIRTRYACFILLLGRENGAFTFPRREREDVGGLRPFLPRLGHRLDPVGLTGREVVQFAAVGFDVVKLPRGLRTGGDELPLT